jgi:hypothetical protein
MNSSYKNAPDPLDVTIYLSKPRNIDDARDMLQRILPAATFEPGYIGADQTGYIVVVGSGPYARLDEVGVGIVDVLTLPRYPELPGVDDCLAAVYFRNEFFLDEPGDTSLIDDFVLPLARALTAYTDVIVVVEPDGGYDPFIIPLAP